MSQHKLIECIAPISSKGVTSELHKPQVAEGLTHYDKSGN
jgi:hypothetical protein